MVTDFDQTTKVNIIADMIAAAGIGGMPEEFEPIRIGFAKPVKQVLPTGWVFPFE